MLNSLMEFLYSSKICEILPSESFGYGQVLRVHDYSDYGDIYALSRVAAICIPYNDFSRIPKDQLKLMFNILNEKHTPLEYRICQKLKVPFKDFIYH